MAVKVISISIKGDDIVQRYHDDDSLWITSNGTLYWHGTEYHDGDEWIGHIETFMYEVADCSIALEGDETLYEFEVYVGDGVAGVLPND